MEKCNVIECDVYKGIKLFKGRWVSVILFSLRESSKSFSTISNEFTFLTNSQLSNTLKKMSSDSLIINNDGNYTLTDKGLDLTLICDEIELFNKKYKLD